MARRHRLAAALLAALGSCPGAASAAVFDVAIFADVSGTNSYAVCGDGQVFPYCPQAIVPYEASLSRYLGLLDLAPGDNPFSWGGYYGSGLITGIIANDNGLLTGRDLTYAYAGCSGPCPGEHVWASAATFRVTGGVPEPATWATLLLGLGFVGWALRQRPKPASLARGARALLPSA